MSLDTVWAEHVDSYLTALQGNDRSAALRQVQQLQADGNDVPRLIRLLLSPAQRRIGELWVGGAWSVAQEHAATATSEAVLTALAASGPTEPPPGAPRLVVGCVEQEAHTLPALMVAEQLRGDGFAVTYVGAGCATTRLVSLVHDLAPSAVLLSCSLATFLVPARGAVEAVRENGTPVVFGGAAVDPRGRRARALGASASAPSAAEVAAVLRTLPGSVPPASPLTHPGAEEAWTLYADRAALAEQTGRRFLEALDDADSVRVRGDEAWLQALHDQLPHVVGSVAGALLVDDRSIVADTLTWADAVLRYRDAPVGAGTALRHALRVVLRDRPEASRLLPEPTRPTP